MNLGKCCICEKEDDSVRNAITLDKKSPAGTVGGWGCFVCNLPSEGAVSVICDDCFENYVDKKTELKFACLGYPGENKRIPIEELTEDFHHDKTKHEEDELSFISDSVVTEKEMNDAGIQIEEIFKIGENDYGYQFGICRIGKEWHGFASGADTMFFLPHAEDANKSKRLIKLVGAIAQSPEYGYGGIHRWFVIEELRGQPSEFLCATCGSVGCTPEEHLNDFDFGDEF